MIKWFIGCSGFHYKDWKETFYPKDLPQRKWFEHYSQHFNTLELNVTFYRFPQLSFLENWYDKSPDDFKFAVKAPRAITHYKKFNEVGDMLTDFYDTISKGLKEKLGPVLFQLPPSVHFSEELLERIIKSLDSKFLNVLEFRHESWWQDSVYEELARHNISFSGMSHPKLPKGVVMNTPQLYYRFHGAEKLYASNYSDEELEDFVQQVKGSHKIKEVYVYFNNTDKAYAVGNAKTLVNFIS